uniref:TIL domain-containing protein n=1 Tax=Rhabditophanes sp. KR3021 TaxID=114890 RepID=A0AC35UDJ6_9BILA
MLILKISLLLTVVSISEGNNGYAAPPPQNSYQQGPPQQQSYQQPPQQNSYQPPQQSYQPPPQQHFQPQQQINNYQQPQQNSYQQGPPQQQNYQRPQQNNYQQGPPPQQNYQRPQQNSYQQGPPQQQNYQRPQQNSYQQGPPPQQNYQRPQQNSYQQGPPQQQNYQRPQQNNYQRPSQYSAPPPPPPPVEQSYARPPPVVTPYVPPVVVTEAPYVPPVIVTEAPYVPPVTEAPYVPPVTEAPYVPPVTQSPYIPPVTQKPSCMHNTVYMECGTCENHCNRNEIACSSECKPSGCFCSGDHAYDSTGNCIQRELCPKPYTSPPKVTSKPYTRPPKVTSKPYTRPPKVTPKPGYGCEDGSCEPVTQPPTTVTEAPYVSCGKNEYFNGCGKTCESSCGNIKDFCPQICDLPACFCSKERGFVRNDQGACIKISECPVFFFGYDDVVLNDITGIEDRVINMMADPRFIITASANVKVLAHVYNIVTGQGDMFHVSSVDFIGRNYLIQMPKPSIGAVQIIHLLPTETDNTFVSVRIIVNRQIVAQYPMNLSKELGSKQVALIIPAKEYSATVYIYATKALFVTTAVTSVDEDPIHVDPQMPHEFDDYSAIMPQPIQLNDCLNSLNPPTDLRMVTTLFTKSLFVTPAYSFCSMNLPITIFNDVDNTNGTVVNLSTLEVTKIDLNVTQYNFFGIQSTTALAPLTRFGSYRSKSNSKKLVSAFMHYIPETTQYISGQIQFVTIVEDSVLEIYGDNSTDPTVFLLDGFEADFLTTSSRGYHTFSSSGKYIAYVVGKNVLNRDGTYGYLVGMNKTRLTFHDDAKEPIVPIPFDNFTTTTQQTLITSTKGAASRFLDNINKFVLCLMFLLKI